MALAPTGRLRAFTLMELVFGMMITSLVAGAAAAITSAVCVNWQASDQSASVNLRESLATSRIATVVRESRYFGLCRGGSVDGSATPGAALMIWRNDSGPTTGAINLSELALLQHDPVTQNLTLYEIVWPTNLSPVVQLILDRSFSYSAIIATTAPEDFKAYPYVTAKVIAHNVAGAKFAVVSLGQSPLKPSLEFALQFSGRGTNETRYAAATVRAPSQQPP